MHMQAKLGRWSDLQVLPLTKEKSRNKISNINTDIRAAPLSLSHILLSQDFSLTAICNNRLHHKHKGNSKINECSLGDNPGMNDMID